MKVACAPNQIMANPQDNVIAHAVARVERFRFDGLVSSDCGAVPSGVALGCDGSEVEAWRARQAMDDRPQRCRA